MDYTFSQIFVQAEVNYCFEAGQLFPLISGNVLAVEHIQSGMQFHLDNGEVATVVTVKPPKVWPAESGEPNEDGNYLRRIIGRIKQTGSMALDLAFGGQTVATTPGHLFYSLDREEWVPAEALHVGEALQNDKGERLRLDGKGPIRHGRIELHNIEVEQLHTYFVGGSPERAALAHNGTPFPGAGCIPKPASLPALSKLIIDWTHIAERHLPGAVYSAGRTVFAGLNRTQIERLIRDAYSKSKLIHTQKVLSSGETRMLVRGVAKVRGTSQKWIIEIWVNRTTRTIETAFPVFPR